MSVSGGAVFDGLPARFDVGLYNSLIATFDDLPDMLQVDAVSGEGEIMALSHRMHPLFGVQFHPESILTEYGQEMIGNFVRVARDWRAK